MLVSMAGGYLEEFDASMQACYSPRDPVAEYLRGDITGRQIRVLGEALPLDSAFVRAINGHAWTEETVLMHDVSTTLRALYVMVGQALDVKPKPKFTPLPTPFDGDSKTTVGSVADQELAAQQRVEMNRTMARIFANPD